MTFTFGWKCCCGCDVVWQDNYSVDNLSQYTKTGTWTRSSNQLNGTSGSQIIGPGTGVTYFEIQSPASFSTGKIGHYDELKLLIRYLDSNNHIYGRLKNNGPATGFPPVYTDTNFEIHQVVAGVDTLVMKQDWFNDRGSYQFDAGAGRLAITDRNGVISFGFGVGVNSDTTTKWFGTGDQYSYNRSTSGSDSTDLTISCYIPGSPKKCGIEIVSSAADLRFDNWDSREGAAELKYGEDNDCVRLLSRNNMLWQIPEVFTCYEISIDGLPGGWDGTVKAYMSGADVVADGGDLGFTTNSPVKWFNVAAQIFPNVKTLNLIHWNAGQCWELTTYDSGDYQWYYSDDFPLDPRNPITLTRNDGVVFGGSRNWSSINPNSMPNTLELIVIN